MKIGIDISQIVYEGTGTATYTRNLVERLLEIDKNNHYVLFGSSLRKKSDLEEFTRQLKAKARLYNFPPTVMDLIWNQWHLFSIENLIGKIDVFHSSDWTQPPAKARKVTTIHDLVAYKFPESLHPKIVDVHKRRLEWVKREVDKIIAVSQSTKRDIVELLHIPESKIEVIYEAPGNETEEWKKFTELEKRDRMDTVRKKYNLDGPFILAVGKREPRKNVNRVLEAMASAEIDASLVIAGNYGWGEDVKVNPKIKLLGFVPAADLQALYAGAKMLVYPSLYEGFGLPVVEAMSCGCPVITSNTSSLPEVGGSVAIYVDPTSPDDISEKIKFLLDLPSQRYAKFQKDSMAQAAKFSWEKAAKETIEAYEKLLSH